MLYSDKEVTHVCFSPNATAIPFVRSGFNQPILQLAILHEFPAISVKHDIRLITCYFTIAVEYSIQADDRRFRWKLRKCSLLQDGCLCSWPLAMACSDLSFRQGVRAPRLLRSRACNSTRVRKRSLEWVATRSSAREVQFTESAVSQLVTRHA